VNATSDLPSKYRAKHSIVVIELDVPQGRSEQERTHVYVTSTSLPSDKFLHSRFDQGDDSWLPGKPVRLLQQLVHGYKPSRSKTAIERRLKETRERLNDLGYVVYPSWRVYVLDVDPDSPTRIVDRGSKNHVVYVGQTSKDIHTRLLEHRGERLGKNNRYLGAPRTKGRSPRLNYELTPDTQVYCKQDALELERKYSQQLDIAGYRVLGDGMSGPSKQQS
jgi:hypothetical protein